MSIFKKSLSSKNFEFETDVKVPIIQTSVNEDGTQIEEVVLVTEEEYNNMNRLPNECDYKLRDLLAAGVDLKDISTVGLLDSHDFFDQSVKVDKLTSSMLDKLHEFESNRNIDNNNINDKTTE